MAYMGDENVDYIYFDEHSDDNRFVRDFNCGSFINYMKSDRHFVTGVGDNICPNGRIAKWYKASHFEKILDNEFRENIFLSYDVDVFDPCITRAHDWTHDGELFPEQVKDISERIVSGKNLVGLNVASYRADMERSDGYKTVDVIVDILKDRL